MLVGQAEDRDTHGPGHDILGNQLPYHDTDGDNPEDLETFLGQGLVQMHGLEQGSIGQDQWPQEFGRVDKHLAHQSQETVADTLGGEEHEDGGCRVGLLVVIQGLGCQLFGTQGTDGGRVGHDDDEDMFLLAEGSRVQEAADRTLCGDQGHNFAQTVRDDDEEDGVDVDGLGLKVEDFGNHGSKDRKTQAEENGTESIRAYTRVVSNVEGLGDQL